MSESEKTATFQLSSLYSSGALELEVSKNSTIVKKDKTSLLSTSFENKWARDQLYADLIEAGVACQPTLFDPPKIIPKAP